MRATKNLATLIATGMLAFSLAACGGGAADSADTKEEPEVRAGEVEETPEATADEQQEEAATEEESASQESAKIAVTIDRARLTTDYDGNPAVIVTYTFTNVSDDEAQSFMVSCVDEVYQNGVQCESTYISDLEGDDMAKVKAGASTSFEKAYKVSDNSPVDIEVRELFSWDNVVLAQASYTFE